MGAPVTLLLIVSLTGGEVRLEQLRATLRTQLDPALVRLVVRRADGVQNLEQMIDEAAAKGPVAVVTNPRRGSFKIKVALQPDRWVSRVFTFAAGDPIRERNRTVALAIATMTPDWRLAEPLPELEPAPEEAGLVPRLGEAEPFGYCVGCTSDGQCAAPTGHCDRRSGTCVACLSSSHCAATAYCAVATGLCQPRP